MSKKDTIKDVWLFLGYNNAIKKYHCISVFA